MAATVRKIALVGAESTGKTWLAEALGAALRGRGHCVSVVPEVLREWCARASRTPRAEEQRDIAEEQARQADTAQGEFVVADTAPLMVAVYSELVFGDRSLYPMALQHQRGYGCTLLTGLDVPWVADGLQREGPHVREPVDALVRQALARGGIAYQVVYGLGPKRLQNALDAIDSVAKSQHPS